MAEENHKDKASRRRRLRGGKQSGLVEESPRLRIHRERRKRTAKRIAVGIAAFVVLAIFATAAWAFIVIRGAENKMSEKDPVVDSATKKELAPKPEPKQPFTILLLGADYRPKDKFYRADTIVLARVDPEKKKVWLVSIPRDTKITVEGRGTMKINAAYYGGPANMIKAVKDLTGLPINYYMKINFRGFQRMVDALGGVYIDVPVEIDDYEASGHSPGHRARHIDAGYQLLDGEHALTFVRARHQFVDQDFSRMRNQQLFFKALAKRASDPKNILRLPRLINYTGDYTKTNMSVGTMYDFAMSLRGMSEDDIDTTTLKGEWVSPYIITDEVWRDYVVDVIKRGGSFEATPSIEPTAVTPKDISVTVRNGAGIGGVAKEAADKLVEGGFTLGEVGNANQFVYDETLVVYKDSEAAAKMVLGKLPVGRVVPARGMYTFGGDVLVVVGKDWRIPKNKLSQVNGAQ